MSEGRADRTVSPGGFAAAVGVVDRAVLAANRGLMIVAFALMTVLVFAGVALRYLTNENLVWAEELSRYLMVWLTFLGIGPLLRLGGHVAVDTLQSYLPRAAAIVMRALVAALIALFAAYLIYAGWLYVSHTWLQTTPVLLIRFAWVAAAVPVGFALTLWHLAMIARGYVRDGTFETSADLDPDQAASL